MNEFRFWLWHQMRTTRQRIRLSVFGILLWVACVAFAFAGQQGWALTFAVLTVIWMSVTFGFMVRDHWENRP